MNRLIVLDCLCRNVVRVLEEERHKQESISPLYAVFRKSIVKGKGEFCGVATADDINKHPFWIFADLVEHRKNISIAPTLGVRQALTMMNKCNVDALPILDKNTFVGVVTRKSILEKLLSREHQLLKETLKLKKNLATEHKLIKKWSEKLTELHEASRSLLTVLTHTTVESDVLQIGIESLSKLLEARYGAIGILDESGKLKYFVYCGLTAEQAHNIGRFPEGKGILGVVIHENVSLRLDDMSKHPQSSGFPEHHPPMKTLLAVPISCNNHVYGRIYLSEKENNQLFSKYDEDLALSFAHSLSLILDNAREIEEVKHARQCLDYIAHFDSVTDLPNRSLLKDRADQAILHAQRNSHLVGILFLDLDNFKIVNDTMGHTLGDVLLKEVANRILSSLRSGDTAARFGGDEFVVLLPDITEIEDAAVVANKILEALIPPFNITRHEIFVSISIGISIFPNNSLDIDGLLADADAAMYYAKKLGKNNYQFFTQDMNYSAQNHVKLEKYLRRALELNELVLYYQPQIDIRTGEVVAVEALIRWFNPKLGMIMPGDFIPFAEETGLIVPIGEWALKTACRQARCWQENGSPIRVAVNLSSRQFHQVPNQKQNRHPLLDTVLNALDETGLPPNLLELEITEGILMQRVDTTMEILNAFKKIGVRLSVDDFGTGYSSLSYLKRFPIDMLKIDKSFVNDITSDLSDKAIVAAIIAITQQLKLEVIAEGVETIEQLDSLMKMGCQYGQGYYFDKPLPFHEVMFLSHQGRLP